jgi:hypothetical protein
LMLMDSIGSIWMATFKVMVHSLRGDLGFCKAFGRVWETG